MIDSDRAELARLRNRCAAKPAEREPVEHAAARFQLGTHYARLGDFAAAEEHLCVAAELFAGAGLAAEHGSAMSTLGAALRAAGRADEAAAVLERAVAALDAAGARTQEAAARYNLALVRRDRGDLDGAVAAASSALEIADDSGSAEHAAAAARELGRVLIERGDAEAALPHLERAAQYAERAGDGRAAAVGRNLLGLARLGCGDAAGAIEAFTASAGASPRSLRPAAFALAKANLALAHEAAGDLVRARAGARQALSVAEADAPVAAQAAAILDRVPGDDDVAAILGSMPPDEQAVFAREEVVRLATVDGAQRTADLGRWVDAHGARADATELGELLLGALLELPPDDMETVIAGLVDAATRKPDDVRDRFRSHVSSAMARFNVPQWMRLKDTFNRIARDCGDPATWG